MVRERKGEMLFGDRDGETAFGGGEVEEEGGDPGEDGMGGSLLSPMGEEGKRRNVLHFNRHINLRRDN